MGHGIYISIVMATVAKNQLSEVLSFKCFDNIKNKKRYHKKCVIKGFQFLGKHNYLRYRITDDHLLAHRRPTRVCM